MALNSVINLVKEYLPFLADGTQDAIITSRILQVRYFLQKYTGLSDAEVELENKYSNLQNILVAKVTAYELLSRRSVQITGGDSTSGSEVEAETTFLKKAKADVVEAEFGQIDVSKSATLAGSIKDMLAGLLTEVCSTAQVLEYSLPYCPALCWDTYQPFIIVTDC